MLLINMFGLIRLILYDPKKFECQKLYLNLLMQVLSKPCDVGSVGILITVARGTWHGASTILQSY